MFLDESDLVRLTGKVRPSAQRRWLLQHGYPHEVNALGCPVVLIATVEARLGLKQSTKKQPNFAAIDGGKCDANVGGT